MKRVLFILLILSSSIINAQNPILNLDSAPFANVENAYYKDVDNYQNQFVGTWVYTDATKTIRFKFIKKPAFYSQSIKNCYVDFLVGEMQYIENGVEKINSLSNLNINHSDIHSYNLCGFIRAKNDLHPLFLDYPSTSEKMYMFYNEPTNNDIGLTADFVMRRADENGVQKIKIRYVFQSGPMGLQPDFETPSTTTNFTIPYGDYTLKKEP